MFGWGQTFRKGRQQGKIDPSTFRHAPKCEHVATTDPTIIRAILKISEREGYWWVEYSGCDCGWQVPYYAA